MRLALSVLALLCATSFAAVLNNRGSAVEAGTARRMSVAAMVDAADLVVQGRVIHSEARIGARGLIETEYTLAVARTFWGEPLDQRSVTLPGGVLSDGRGLVLAGMPALRTDEEVLLFLSRASSSGIRMPIGLAQGKFAVERTEEGALRLVRDQAGLQLANPATGEVEEAERRGVHDYAEVVAEIHAAAAARHARAEEGAGEGE